MCLLDVTNDPAWQVARCRLDELAAEIGHGVDLQLCDVGGEPWFVATVAIAPDDGAFDDRDLLLHNQTLAVGALGIGPEGVQLRHVGRAASVHASDLALLVHEAARLRKFISGAATGNTNLFDFYAT